MSSFTDIFQRIYREFKLFAIASQNFQNMYFQEHISTDTFGKEKFNLIALKIFKLRIFCKFYRWITFYKFSV